ncbi:hypothetical protein, partial [Lacticaseibacillus rhamnosus]|uniref:hypothetical protein n=1 Tax=Lacticaseibacillus rhamnosus TaxID=47715 RepID=UPI0007E16EF9
EDPAIKSSADLAKSAADDAAKSAAAAKDARSQVTIHGQPVPLPVQELSRSGKFCCSKGSWRCEG